MRKVSTILFLSFVVIFSTAQTVSILWSEDFSGLGNGDLPDGWVGDASKNWGAFGSSNAGGTSPEMVFWWQPEGSGAYDLVSPLIKTSEFTELQFSFKHRIRNFGDPGLYTLSVKVLSDGESYPIVEWVDPGTVAAEELSFVLNSNEHKVGSDDFRIVWTFNGPTNNITQWDIDDVTLTEVGAEGVLSINPTSHTYADQQIGLTSAPQIFSLENTGSAPLSLESGQINIRAEGPQSTDLKVMSYNIWFDSQNWPVR